MTAAPRTLPCSAQCLAGTCSLQSQRPAERSPHLAVFGATTLLRILLSIAVQPVHAAEPVQASIKIGILLPADATEAATLRSGAEQGIAIGRQAGIAIDLVARGRLGQWGIDGEEAVQLALADGAQGLISPPSGTATHLVLQIAGRTAIPVTSLCPDSSVTGAGIPWMRQVVPETKVEAGTLFRHFASREPQRSKFWLAIVPEGRQGREILHDLREAAKNIDATIKDVFELRSDGSIAFRTEDAAPSAASSEVVRNAKPGDAHTLRAEPLVARLRSSPPDGVMLWVCDSRAASVLDLVLTGRHGMFVAGPGRLFSPDFRAKAGELASRIHIAIPASLVNTAPVNFRALPGGTAPAPGDPDWLRGMACDAVLTLMNQLRTPEAGDGRARGPAPFESGVTGPLNYSADGRRQTDLTVITANGKRVAAK